MSVGQGSIFGTYTRADLHTSIATHNSVTISFCILMQLTSARMFHEHMMKLREPPLQGYTDIISPLLDSETHATHREIASLVYVDRQVVCGQGSSYTSTWEKSAATLVLSFPCNRVSRSSFEQSQLANGLISTIHELRTDHPYAFSLWVLIHQY